jgi:chloramphenicol 3-O phosphotransferase
MTISAPGRVVILNGTSSSGKSTLATRFRNERADAGEFWLIGGIDEYNEKLPDQWFRGGGYDGSHSDDGVRFEPTADGLVVRVGDAGRRLYAAYRRSVAAWAWQGFDVVVDDVAFDAAAVEDWADALAGLRVSWVAIRCAPDVAEARERARADRIVGLARGLSAVVHSHARYHFEIDTSALDVAVGVRQLSAFIDSTPSSTEAAR